MHLSKHKIIDSWPNRVLLFTECLIYTCERRINVINLTQFTKETFTPSKTDN